MSDGQHLTLDLLLLLVVVMLFLTKPAKGFWGALFTRNKIQWNLNPLSEYHPPAPPSASDIANAVAAKMGGSNGSN